MKLARHSFFVLLALPLFHACAGDDSPSSSSGALQNTGGTGGGPWDGCTRGTLESDFAASPPSGPGIVDMKLAPGQYIVSSTYLQLKPDALARFEELLGPVMSDLGTRDGLVALSLGGSRACGSARTLAVWRDDASMFAFVVGDAHSAAMAAVGEISRGGSVVTHWSGDQDSATWAVAAAKLAAEDGTQY